MWTGCPWNRTLPPSVVWIPAIAFTSVDLPAPLSPTRATTSPARTAKSTPWSACTGPKRLLTPSSERIGAPLSGLIAVSARVASSRSRLLDPGRRAGALELPLAEVGGLDVAALHDALDVVLQDRDRRQDHRRHLLLAVVDLLVDQARG